MSSNTAYFGRHPQEMNRVSLVKSKTILNHDKCQFADAHSTSKICKDNIDPTNHGCTDRTYLLYHKDRTHLKNDSTDCPVYDKCESKMCSICQCSLEKEVKCFTCKCEIRQSDHCDLTKNSLCTCSYFNLLNRSSVTRDYSDYSLDLSVLKSTDIQWKSYTWRGIFIIIIAMLCTNICNADPSKCAVGIRTPGWTEPHGDIVLEHGDSLEIRCILNKTYIDLEYPGKNSSDLVFFRNMKEMEPEYITIENETTILMKVERPSPAEDMYYCKLRLSDDDNQHLAVCLNKVVIGFKPKEPENFTCISHNWENLICSWDPVKNFVTTRFTLLFKLPGRAGGRKLFPCPKQNKPNTCLWDASTNPIYRQPYEYYSFILNIENMLGNLNVSYKFHHFAHVIPAKPANLSVVNKTEKSAMLHWSVPFPMQNFPPGLHHRITYQNQWENEEDWKVINITNDIHAVKRYYNLTGLNYSNTGYDIRVYMKSAVAVGEDKWSEFSGITFRTPAELPALPPRTDIGSFEIAENTLYRDIYLYWQTIPSHLENGKNFRYQIYSVEENGRKVELLPNETTKTYAKYKGINLYSTYRFELVSMNLVGMSKGRSQIIVPSKYDTPPEPIAFTKIAFDGGLYELSWKPPVTNTEITNYTIFWCNNERDRPYQCTGYLDWVHVSKNTTVYNMTVPNAKLVYQFAISVNTKKGSSGMVWSSCTVIHNKVVGKMKSVWINHIDSDYIDAGWKMDCSDRIGIIEKYTIYYCPIVSPLNINCKGPKLNKTIKADPQTIRGSVRGLKPYTTYMIAVSVTTKNGESLHSDPLFNTTLEAAPSTPPKDVTIVNVTNTTMFITWKPPDAMNGVLRYYKVYYNGYVQKVEEANHIELKELLAYKNYSVNVVACTVACSVKSPTIYKVTEIGVPGKIFIPNVRFMNSSQVMIKWSKPQNSAGHLDYYEISSSDGEIQNSTKTEAQIPIPNCKTVGKEKLYQFRVRAVNIAPSNTYLKGPWSDPGEGNCYSDGPSFKVWVVIWMIGIISAVAFIFGIVYTTKIMWRKCKAMQDVEVQLPPGLAPNMKLLQKGGEQHIRQSSADSSGCSSGQESVTSSLTSNSRVSSDSGTEIDPIPITPNKLLETLPVWEGSSSLRQRNISVTRPALVTETARWDSYVAKSAEPIIGDTSSLARSTPNLTDTTGYTTSQHTWSSTGYISMPSSEELSSNPSLVPKEPFNANSFITNEGASKPMISESEENAEMIETVSNKPEKKLINPYTALAYLEQIEKDKKVTDSFRDIDNMEFTERNKLTSETIMPLTISDKTYKPYVQTGIIDMLRQPLNMSNTDPKRSTTSTSFATTSLTDSCNKPFVSSFVNPTTITQNLIDSSSKSYVAVASVSEIIKKSNTAISSLNSSKKSCAPCTTTDGTSKPYVLATSVLQMLQRQKEKTETPKSEIHENKNDDSLASFPIYWRSSENLKPSKELGTDKMILETNKSSGYVTIAENPKLDQQIVPSTTSTSYIQHDRFNKPLPQNTVGQSSDEQYCKVTVVPSTMQ
ncbi:uncharacterized protein LOC122514466 [Polistes fuscatus]|uniref:uncharacterized protein LOC122514466 n=1 Tax=Polistes fuscatus TaxID=30207 RepID=UPI001CA93EDA|nr:uncharacterized protein LOC122514466 [Polistes fuscatus]XP_043487261.1 uncharacterized protein LOC122514466 [Polistes fuscatus]